MTPRQRANKLAATIKAHYHLADCVPIWSSGAAQKYGGKLNKNQMAFAMTLPPSEAGVLKVICPFSKKLLLNMAEADVIRLAGAAVIGCMKMAMLELMEEGDKQ